MSACSCDAKTKPESQQKRGGEDIKVIIDEWGQKWISADLSAAQSKLDLVVSHYEERLDWLQDAAKSCRQIWVYHKGHTLKTLGFYINLDLKNLAWIARVKWIRLSNVGRESHTILHHCLQIKLGNIKAQPDDHTLFLQGKIDDHRHLVFPYWKWTNYLKQDYVGGGVQEIDLSEGIKFPQKLLDQLEPNDMTFPQYYQHLLGLPFPGKLWVSYCNLFAVKNRRILAHSKEFYERALATLNSSPNPITGHYFERLNASIFAAFADPFRPIQ